MEVNEDKVESDSVIPPSNSKDFIDVIDLRANESMVSFCSQAKLSACVIDFGSNICQNLILEVTDKTTETEILVLYLLVPQICLHTS